MLIYLQMLQTDEERFLYREITDWLMQWRHWCRSIAKCCFCDMIMAIARERSGSCWEDLRVLFGSCYGGPRSLFADNWKRRVWKYKDK